MKNKTEKRLLGIGERVRLVSFIGSGAIVVGWLNHLAIRYLWTGRLDVGPIVSPGEYIGLTWLNLMIAPVVALILILVAWGIVNFFGWIITGGIVWEWPESKRDPWGGI